MARRSLTVVVLAFAVAVASCANAERRSTVTDPTQVTEATQVTVATEATQVTEATEVTQVTDATEVTDIAYLDLRGEVLRLDVLVPAGDGPWPVLVDFHGNSAAGRNAASTTVVSEKAAARGMVVFTPSWIPSDAFPLMLDDIEELAAAGSCAVAVAQELAPDFGGDPERTAVHGFSAGAGPGTFRCRRSRSSADRRLPRRLAHRTGRGGCAERR